MSTYKDTTEYWFFVDCLHQVYQQDTRGAISQSTKSKISTPIETHPVILSARRRWERHVVAALEDLRRESKLPLVDSVTSSSVDFMSLRYVWEPEELFSVLQSLSSPNRNNEPSLSPWGLIKLSMHVPSLTNLANEFTELSPNKYVQIGVDDLTFNNSNNNSVNSHIKLAADIAGKHYPPQCRHFCRQGVPSVN
ncbi:hypothetical protein P9112_012259 [Eukaryota sp. TZLM1-RC]